MNNINVGVNPVRDTSIGNVSVKSDNKQAKEVQKKEPNEVNVSSISQRLNAGSTPSVRDDISVDESKEIASQVAGGQKQLADAQSAHITMEFVESLLNKSPYEQPSEA